MYTPNVAKLPEKKNPKIEVNYLPWFANKLLPQYFGMPKVNQRKK